MFQLVYDTFKCLTGTEAIGAWESKGQVKALTLRLPLMTGVSMTVYRISSKAKLICDINIALETKKSCLKRPKESFTLTNERKLFTVDELHTWSQELNAGFTRKDCLFQPVKLTKKADSDKYFY